MFSIAYADGTGSFLVLLAVAEREALFQKYGLNVRSVGVKGATIPRLTADMPLGMIGEPAVLLQATEGADLRLVASATSSSPAILLLDPGSTHRAICAASGWERA